MNPSFFFKKITRAVINAPYLAWLLLIGAFVSVYFVAEKVKLIAETSKNMDFVDNENIAVLKKIPLGSLDYSMALNYCKDHTPTVKCSVNSGNLYTVTISSPEHYEDFIFALSAIQSLNKFMIWESKSLCVGRCDGGAAVAILQASTQKVELN